MKIYCSCCNKVQPVKIDDCRDAKTNELFQDIVCVECDLVIASGTGISQPNQKTMPTLLNGMRKAIYDLDCSLWRARAAAERNGEQHTQLGHAIDALTRLQGMFQIATPQPDTAGTRSWFTVDELNAWADKYNKEYGVKEQP